jgi:2-keto-3-deoxy-galactonokinase
MAVLLVFATLLALPATHCKWHRLEPCRADDLATVQAGPVRTLIERANGLSDSLQHFRLHLDQGKRQIFVGLGLERFAQVWGVVIGAGSFFANVAYPALNLKQ